MTKLLKNNFNAIPFIMILISFLLLTPSYSQAIPTAFTAYSNNAVISVTSCEVFTDEIFLKNTGTEILTFKIKLSGSAARFTTIIPSESFVMPGETRVLYAFISPGCDMSGTYYLKTFFETNYGEKVLKQKLIVQKPSNIELRTTRETEKACSNETQLFEFEIKNIGNFKEHYLFTTGALSDRASITPSDVWLMPNESKVVKLEFNITKAGTYKTIFRAHAETSKLKSEIPLKFAVEKCIITKPFLSRIRDILTDYSKYLKWVFITLLFIVVILVIISIIKRLLPAIKKSMERKRAEQEKKRVEKPYYKEIGKRPRLERRLKIKKPELRAAKVIKREERRIEKKKGIKEKEKTERARHAADYLKWIVFILWIFLILFAVCYFLGFQNVKEGIYSSAVAVKNFCLDVLAKIRMSVANLFSKIKAIAKRENAEEKEEKELESRAEETEEAESPVNETPAENNRTEQKNYAGGIKPIIQIINNESEEAEGEEAESKAQATQIQTTEEKFKKETQEATEQHGSKVDLKKIATTLSPIKEFLSLYLNYIILGIAVLIVLIALMRVSELQTRKIRK